MIQFHLSRPTMANAESEARLRFLEASARHYVALEPATSAHLMAQRANEASGSGITSNDKHPKDVCKACGSISIPGTTSGTSIVRNGTERKRSKVRSKKNVKNNSDSKMQRRDFGLPKYLRIDCLICYRYEIRPLLGPKAQNSKPTKNQHKPGGIVSTPRILPAQGDLRTMSPASQTEPPNPPAANTGSKKRAKARKQGGLQAMLEKSKASTSSSSGFGLELLDLMKQS